MMVGSTAKAKTMPTLPPGPSDREPNTKLAPSWA